VTPRGGAPGDNPRVPLALDVLTLFPPWFDWLREERHVRNALEAGELALGVHDLRAWSELPHHAVDDTPYGGGAGMVVRVDVTTAAVEGVHGAPLDEVRASRRVVALDARGRRFDDAYARELAASDAVTLLCGRYEGFDQRVLDHVATEALSLGPYVLAGGEAAAMVVVDAVARHLPGALGAEESAEEESFAPALDGLPEYPHYTRPLEFRGWGVPEVLRSGDHGRIAAWRREQSERAAGGPAGSPRDLG
jgi:tRNA (guanine37-N1)-methyltransferase